MSNVIEPGARCEAAVTIDLSKTYQGTFAKGEHWFKHNVPGYGWYFLYFAYDDPSLQLHEKMVVYWHQDCRSPHDRPPRSDNSAPRVNIPEIVDGLPRVATYNTLAPAPFLLGLKGKEGTSYQLRVEQAPGGHTPKHA